MDGGFRFVVFVFEHVESFTFRSIGWRAIIENFSQSEGVFYRPQYGYFYKITLTNPLDVRDFDISANTLSNGYMTGVYDLAYRYSGGSVIYSNPTYII